MTKAFLYNFIRQHRLAVISTISKEQKAESALVGFAVSENLEIIFDTVKTSRKHRNILQNPQVAVVIGWDNETTVQYEGIATELAGEEAVRFKEIYFAVYPDGRERAETWPGLVYFKITPNWIRYSNFNEPVVIEEMMF
ncbi:MAG TPA: pyridoxamine 5'-phosphate oxidase family protein [Mucilaginibacter sp.]|jgi:general stress protein 26